MESIKLSRDIDTDIINSKNKSLPNIDSKEFFEDVSAPVTEKPSIKKETIVITKNKISLFEMIIIIIFFLLLNTKFMIQLVYSLNVLELNPHSHFLINLIIRTLIFSIILYLIKKYSYTIKESMSFLDH